jgi:uncharacterized protein
MPSASNRLPTKAGIGLRTPHVNEVLAQRPEVPFFEVHSENYYLDGGPALAALARIRADYPLSLHGVGMSLASADPLDRSHVEKLRTLIARIEPALVSEHLCWSGFAGRHLNDLLPLPYTDEALALACARVSELQERLGHEVAIENISSYLTFADSTIPEWDFIAALARRTGCKLLLDVNNIYVNATNHGFDADAYVAAIPPDAVAEIHLAGFEEADGCLIDTHGAPVAPDVWALYARTIERLGSRPTLIEWDTDIPGFAVLQREAATAQRVLEACNAIVA